MIIKYFPQLNDLNSNGFTLPFTNTISGGQEIFVRVLNNDSKCYNGATSFNVVVAELPTIVNPIVTIEQCDSDEDNNGKTKFRPIYCPDLTKSIKEFVADAFRFRTEFVS